MLSLCVAAIALMPVEADYVVQPFYVYPADQPLHQEYIDAINKLIPEVQEWYRARAGVTFRTARLQVRKGDDYLTMRGGPAPSDDVRNDIQQLPNWWGALEKAIGGARPKSVVWVFAQGGGGYAGANLWGDWIGMGVFGDWVLEPISGLREPKAIHSGYATWQVKGGTPKGTTVHELGHAFGLHHPDNYPGKAIMRAHWDYPDTGLLPHEVMILRNSPFFVKGAYDVAAPWLNFENKDVMKWGESVTLTGSRFAQGDEVEFRWVDAGGKSEKSIRMLGAAISESELKVTVPANIGPGFIRIWRGKQRGNIVPVNFYKP